MTIEQLLVPDIGDFENVDVIDVLVKEGDSINKDDSLITLESDKASMDSPASKAGIIKELKIKVGDKVSQGSLIAMLDTIASGAPATETKAPQKQPEPVAEKTVEKIIPEPSRPAPEPPPTIQPEYDFYGLTLAPELN